MWGDVISAQSDRDKVEGKVPAADKDRVGYALAIVRKEFPVWLLNIDEICIQGLSRPRQKTVVPAIAICEDCGTATALTHRMPSDVKLRWCQPCSKNHVGAILPAGPAAATVEVRAEKAADGAADAARPGTGAAWEAQLARLAAYKAEHGDCNVPQRWAEDPQLGS
jgi:hypothetical protein